MRTMTAVNMAKRPFGRLLQSLTHGRERVFRNATGESSVELRSSGKLEKQ
jgi:hypothetical protein